MDVTVWKGEDLGCGYIILLVVGGFLILAILEAFVSVLAIALIVVVALAVVVGMFWATGWMWQFHKHRSIAIARLAREVRKLRALDRDAAILASKVLTCAEVLSAHLKNEDRTTVERKSKRLIEQLKQVRDAASRVQRRSHGLKRIMLSQVGDISNERFQWFAGKTNEQVDEADRLFQEIEKRLEKCVATATVPN